MRLSCKHHQRPAPSGPTLSYTGTLLSWHALPAAAQQHARWAAHEATGSSHRANTHLPLVLQRALRRIRAPGGLSLCRLGRCGTRMRLRRAVARSGSGRGRRIALSSKSGRARHGLGGPAVRVGARLHQRGAVAARAREALPARLGRVPALPTADPERA